jgi:membrane protease YdiL (CAAX protease family)
VQRRAKPMLDFAAVMAPKNAMQGSAVKSRYSSLLRALLVVGKVEAKLCASIVLGLVFSVAMAFIPGVMNLDWRMVATVDRCEPGIDQAIDQWLAARRQQGWAVAVTRNEAPSLPVDVDPSTRVYHVTYSGMTLPGYLRLYAATDPELLPPAFDRNCEPRSFDFGAPLGAGAAVLPGLLLAGWYAAIVLLAGWSLRGAAQHRGARNPPGWRRCFLWIGLGLLTALTVMLIARGLQEDFGIEPQSGQRDSILAMVRADPWLLYLFVLVGPFCEELLFRGWLLRDFVAIGTPRFGSIAVSFSFAGMHLIGDPANASTLAYAALVFLISIALCWVYLRYRSLLASTLTHMAHNAASILAVLVTNGLASASSP